MAKPREQQPRSLREFEAELDLLVEDYAGGSLGSARLSVDDLIEGTGRAFTAQCLRKYGSRGYQTAKEGIRAIIDALHDRLS